MVFVYRDHKAGAHGGNKANEECAGERITGQVPRNSALTSSPAR